jgi:hypothetical protein
MDTVMMERPVALAQVTAVRVQLMLNVVIINVMAMRPVALAPGIAELVIKQPVVMANVTTQSLAQPAPRIVDHAQPLVVTETAMVMRPAELKDLRKAMTA